MNSVPRRTFLKGFGLTVGLPMLELMKPAVYSMAAPVGTGQPVRMGFIFFPNGAIMQSWTPEKTGADFELSETLSPLADFKSDLNVVTGLAQDNGRAKGDGPGDHARCASTFLTGAHPFKTSGADIRVGISVDQVAAQHVGKLTRLPSLELGIDRGRNAGNCDSGYSCAYSSNVSWQTETAPMAKEINPRLAFERLFGSGREAEVSRQERDFFRKSILDLVSDDAERLRSKLGQTDRRKLDEYFQSVRGLEVRIARAEKSAGLQPPELDLPEGVPGDLETHIRLMMDIMVIAFQSDATRISTFMLGNAGDNRPYRMVGVNEGHHSLSHHGNQQGKMDQIRKIDKFLSTQFAYFLKKMKETPDGEGTLLDNSMILYGSGLGDANRHDHHQLPIVMAGRGGGTIRTGRHIKTESEVPLNNLFLSMLDRMDAGMEKVGDSSGRFTQIDL
jgi:hypothetical protein